MNVDKSLVVFDEPYSLETQAEGIAVNQAVIYGHCDNCDFLKKCATDTTFRPPFFAWCVRKKYEIVAQLRKAGAE